MSNEFEPHVLAYNSNVSTSERRLYSTILAEFSWYSEALTLKLESILAHSEELSEFETFLSSLYGFEDALLHFSGNSHMKEIRQLLGMKIIANPDPDLDCVVVASHESVLSLYDFQKLCSVLCAYRFFEIISLRAQCIPRIPNCSPTASMFLPGPASTKDDLDAFYRLQKWPDLVTTFQNLVKNAASGNSEFRAFPNPMFTLMHMAAENNVATKYLAVEENFLLAAIHVAALKKIPFTRGTLPDLPAGMPFAPSGGFRDQESYDRFEAEFNSFIETCQKDGYSCSTAHIGRRLPLQLSVMISPLYLLVTRRLSSKSFHRRTVIDLAARLGPHKPPGLLATENLIWNAIFRLAEGRASSYTVLRDLADSLFWPDINMAANSEHDKEWFGPKLLSFTHPSHLTIPAHTFKPSSGDSLHHKLFLPLTVSTAYVQEEIVVPQPSPGDLETPSTFSTISAPSLGNYSGENDDMSAANMPMVNMGPGSGSGNRLSITRSNRSEVDDFQHTTAADRDGNSGPITPGGRDLVDCGPQLIPEAQDVGQLNGQIDIIVDGSSDDGNGNNHRELFNRRTERVSSTGSSSDGDDDDEDTTGADVESETPVNEIGDDVESETPISKGEYVKKSSHSARPRSSIRATGPKTVGRNSHTSSTKRRLSSSPSPTKLGFKENPIDVDTLASLLEPIVNREFVKKEELSLPAHANPPLKGIHTYTAYDVNGEPHTFTPSFHFPVYHERFRQFLRCVESLYIHGRPLHIAQPGNSIIKAFSYEEWIAMTPVQMQHEQSAKNIVVSGWPPKNNILFDEDGLRKIAGTQSRQISINDYSIKPANNSCGPTVVSGRVRDIWDNRHPSGRILNALDLPQYDGNVEPTEYTSDLHAWDVTRGHHHIDHSTSYPTGHMRWALAGHENSLTFLHIDCEGLGTDVTVADGGKAWGFLHEQPGNRLSSINFFLKDNFRLDQVLHSSDYDLELVALRPGDRLFMMPGQPHFVFGYAHSICLGGHYYLTNHMQKTLQALIHSFILHRFLTNVSHPTRVLLRRLVLFYHMGLIENEIPHTDPAASHLPQVNGIGGLMNLLSSCVLVILGNVLDFRTYRAPTQEEYTKADKTQQTLINHEINTIPLSERLSICYARGAALHLINWVRHCSVITDPRGEIVSNLPSRFFIQIAQTLIKYKEGAITSKLDLKANCTLDMLVKQVDNVVAVDPFISALWSERHLLPSDSLTLADQEGYSVKWLPDLQREWTSISHDFFHDGITALDERYISTQQDRQHLEYTLVIPQLKTYSSSAQRPRKRPRSS